jgi:hypothetical protein
VINSALWLPQRPQRAVDHRRLRHLQGGGLVFGYPVENTTKIKNDTPDRQPAEDVSSDDQHARRNHDSREVDAQPSPP